MSWKTSWKVGVPRCWICGAEVADSGTWCPWPYDCFERYKERQAAERAEKVASDGK